MIIVITLLFSLLFYDNNNNNNNNNDNKSLCIEGKTAVVQMVRSPPLRIWTRLLKGSPHRSDLISGRNNNNNNF